MMMSKMLVAGMVPGDVGEGGHGYQPGLVVLHDGPVVPDGSLQQFPAK
jgi:hypothetical protein